VVTVLPAVIFASRWEPEAYTEHAHRLGKEITILILAMA
jgi:hypothetical protein